MAASRRYALEFMLLNHDEDLMERFKAQWREDVVELKLQPVSADTRSNSREKAPLAAVLANGHERVAASQRSR